MFKIKSGNGYISRADIVNIKKFYILDNKFRQLVKKCKKQCYDQLKNSFEAAIYCSISNALKQIPVSELNKSGKLVNVTKLKNRGIYSYSDLVDAGILSDAQLSYIDSWNRVSIILVIRKEINKISKNLQITLNNTSCAEEKEVILNANRFYACLSIANFYKSETDDDVVFCKKIVFKFSNIFNWCFKTKKQIQDIVRATNSFESGETDKYFNKSFDVQDKWTKQTDFSFDKALSYVLSKKDIIGPFLSKQFKTDIKIGDDVYYFTNLNLSGRSVTQMTKAVHQPKGGYLNISLFEKITFDSNYIMKEEDANPGTVGMATDYLSRVMLGTEPKKAFDISLKGAKIANHLPLAEELLSRIKGLDDTSIVCALELSCFDSVYRALYPFDPSKFKRPNNDTISNIREMVNRTVLFFSEFGPIVEDGFTFGGAYTNRINSGDGDILTKDTLWDLKTNKDKPDSKATLQILIYYLMGRRTTNDNFKSINYLGIFNPRLNVAYRIETKKIDPSIIKTIEKDIIGYK